MKFHSLSNFSILCTLSVLFLACNTKPVACLHHSGGNTTTVNKEFLVISCGSDVDAIQWFVEGGGETIVKGGENCDKSITVKFNSKGEKTVRCIAYKFKKKSKSDCQTMGNDARIDEEIYTIIVE